MSLPRTYESNNAARQFLGLKYFIKDNFRGFIRAHERTGTQSAFEVLCNYRKIELPQTMHELKATITQQTPYRKDFDESQFYLEL
jgi:hypothetical protein